LIAAHTKIACAITEARNFSGSAFGVKTSTGIPTPSFPNAFVGNSHLLISCNLPSHCSNTKQLDSRQKLSGMTSFKSTHPNST
jgi:hypothetical protein